MLLRGPWSQHFGKYTLVTRLATGGMAEIFLARLNGAANFHKHLVLKLMLPEFADDPEFVAMFLEEARITARISHPNVCQVYELGEADGQYFIAMEYLNGVPLSCILNELVRSQRAGDLRLIGSLIAQACEGLHHAHELVGLDGRPAGAIHRDVSPPNLFVTTDGVVKVLDFGVAKARDASARTRSGSIKGKCAYMPPEQLRGEPLDRRVDVFALGVVSFELVSGQRLFRRDNEYQTFKAVSEERIPQLAQVRPDAPPALVEAVARALERDRDRRFPTARAFGEALLGAIAPLGGALAPAAIAAEVERLVAPELAKRRATVAHALLLTGDADREARIDRVESATVVERFTFADTLPIKRRRSRLALLVVGVSAAGALCVLGAARPTAHPPAPAASLPVAAVGAGPVSLPPATRPSSTPTPERSQPRPSTAPLGSAGAATSPRPSTSPRHTAASGARGYFSIDSKPYAAIYIDGKDLGTTPLFRVELPQGRHEVRAVSARGLSQTFNIQVQPGERALTRHLVW